MQKESFTNRPFKIISRARPRRIAFLVDPTNCPPELLDALFKSNYGIWGGRYNPIIPVSSSEISDNYWKLLKFADPDIIYSYCEISGDLIRRLDHELCPLKMVRHRRLPSEEEHPDYSPSACHEQLASTALVPLVLQREERVFQKPILLTSTVESSWQGYRPILRNFGILNERMAIKPYPEGQDKIIINADWTQERFFEELANEVNPVVFPFQASEAYAELPESDNSYQLEYCLVFGDHVQDWIYFWNRIFSLSSYARSRWNTLCISADSVRSQPFRNALRRFLSKFAYRTGSSPARIDLVSSSVLPEDLELIKTELFQGLDAIPRIGRIVPNDTLPVSIKNRSYPEFCHAGSYLFEKNRTTYQQASSRKCLLAIPGSPVSLDRGIWMMDLRIEHVAEYRFYGNEELWWILPQQREIAHLFLPDVNSRITAGQSISAEMSAKDVFELTIPSVHSAILIALGAWPRLLWGDDFRIERKEPFYDRIEPSDKGGYMHGVIRLFGGLQEAGSFLENSFWRSIIDVLSRRIPSAEQKTLISIKNRLRKKAGILAGFSEAPEETIDLLSREVLKQARRQHMIEDDISFEELEDNFLKQREVFIERTPNYRKDSTEEGIEADHAEATRYLFQSFQEYTNIGIFRQGVRLRCDNCGSRYWQDVGDTCQKNTCPGCGGVASLSVRAAWRYRLNTLIKNAVVFHGCVPVVLCLHSLRSTLARHSFLSTTGLELYRADKDKKPAAELDLVCITDGALVIGEVKTNSREFTPEELAKLARHAGIFDADVVVLGCLHDPMNQMAQKKKDLEGILGSAQRRVWTHVPSSHVFEPTPIS